MERLFIVIVPKQPRNKRNMKYQPLHAQKALRLMETLDKRGFTAIAETSSWNGERQHLTFEEMKEIYAEAN